MSSNENDTDIIHEINNQIDEIDSEIYRLNQKRSQLLERKNKIKEKRYLLKSMKLANQDWEKEEFTWSNEVTRITKEKFKIKNFRPQQLKTINALMSKHDVLLLAPTGGGKSLCYQLPACISNGWTIVVSPLISLMEDQVWNLQKLGIEAELLCSTTEKTQVTNILKQLMGAHLTSIKILYVTPERLAKSKRFMSALQKCYFAKKLDRFAIDEVHCCSQWGHDFRPDYKFLGSLKSTFPNIPILGVTATASDKVLIDVQKMLNIKDCLILKAPFNRPNLFYQVMEKPVEKKITYDLLVDLLKNRYAGMTGIIYTLTIKDSEDIASHLLNNDITVRPYHANLDAASRTKIHSKWINGTIQAVVATVAFGMGIDKPDVRFVIHHTMSKSMENFYQESGRAGRDGKRAECLLLYRLADMFRITTMVFTEYTGLQNAYDMVDYCIDGSKCRRDVISKNFSEVWKETDCDVMCDKCFYKDKILPPKIDITNHVKDLYEIIEKAGGMDLNLTGLKLIDIWYKKGSNNNLRCPTVKVPSFDRSYAEQIIAHLIIKGYLKEDFHYTAYTTNSYIKKGTNILQKDTTILLNRSRFLDLPNKNIFIGAITNNDGTNGEVSTLSDNTENDIIFVSESLNAKKKKQKKSKKRHHNSPDNCNQISSSSSLNKSARESESEINLSNTSQKRRKHRSSRCSENSSAFSINDYENIYEKSSSTSFNNIQQDEELLVDDLQFIKEESQIIELDD